jgi:glycosyltransferase involved in cell wall biosynthesis
VLVDTRLPARRRIFERGGATLSQAWRTLRILGTLLLELVRSRPVLVHFNVDALGAGLLRDFVGAVLARAFGVPVVMHYHGLVSELGEGQERRWQRWWLARAIRIAALDLVMNEPSLAYVRALAGDVAARVVLLPNFFDETDLPGVDLAPRKSEEVPRVIFVGGLTRAKGATQVLAVAHELPKVQFRLLGAVYDEVRDEVEAAPPNARVQGEVGHDEVLDEMARSHLLLFPTAHPEGFPYAVLESMAMGLPVVATRIGAIPEMVEDGRGGVLAERTTSDLVRAVREVFSDETRRLEMGRFNRDKSHEQYAYAQVIQRMVEQYRRVARR